MLLLAAGAALYATAGPPRPPAALPDPQLLWATLRGTSLPLEWVAYVLTTLAWAMWAWLSVSLLIRLVLALVDTATRGAAWVGAVRRITDAFTLPMVRRAVDSALAVAIAVQVVARAVPAHAAQLPPEPPPIVRLVDSAAVPRETQRVASYTVQPADTLWSIAERFYGTGHEYPRLVEANVTRAMADGDVFAETGVIKPGWTLRVPLPSTGLEEQDGEVFYAVERGDTLWGISARFLGDPLRWPEIYEQNQGASLLDGRTLSDPNLIWPELRLRLPIALDATAQAEHVAEMAPPVAAEGATIEIGADTAADAAAVALSDAGTMNGAVAGGAALAGLAAALIVRRRGRRGLDEPPIGDEIESEVVVRGGFADLADLNRDGDDAAQTLAQQVLRFFDERGLEGRVGLVSARHGRSSTTLAVVSQRLGDRPRVVEVARGLSSRMGVQVITQLSRDHDVLLRLSHRHSVLLGAPDQSASAPCRLLPVGVMPDRRVLSVNWPALGHVLVAGNARRAVSTVLTSLTASLAAYSRPEQLQILTIARPRVLSATLDHLRHQVGTPIDPTDQLAASAAMHDVRAELLRRMERLERGDSVATLPELVLVLPELDGMLAHLSTLEMLGAYGPTHRMRVLAASTRSPEVPDRLIAHFATRAVLRVTDEHESTRLLGSGAAVDLLGGGQLLLRLDEREPVEAYAFRIAEPELDALARDEDDDEAELSAPPTRGVIPFGQYEPGARVDVRCFGGFDVLSGERDLTAASSPGEAAANASAWELLAYLSAQAEGLAPREEIMHALWPALDGRPATQALRSTIDRLNTLLSLPDVVQLDEHDGTCRLDLERVESDIHRFIRQCRAAPLMPAAQAVGAWARARELYRGDLLDGPGARAYGWATTSAEDGELAPREQFREQFYRATLRQARLLIGLGQVADAVPLLHALLDVEPLLEDVVRDLYRSYAALGDLNSLVQEEQRLRSALGRAVGPEDDPDPEPATTALFARLREQLEARATVPA